MSTARARDPSASHEIEGIGSIYWVISGVIRCRQPILRLAEAIDEQGMACCDIIMAPDMVRTMPRPKSAFQGWRYYDPKDAPRGPPRRPALPRTPIPRSPKS